MAHTHTSEGKNENNTLSVIALGLYAGPEGWALATLGTEPADTLACFPASALGLAALGVFIASLPHPTRLAVGGPDALGVALRLGQTPSACLSDVFILAGPPACSTVQLAHYARSAI